MTKQQQSEQQEAIATLRATLKPGDTLHTILRHTSRSGMQRTIDLVQILPNGSTHHWSYLAAKAIGGHLDPQREGIKVGGCGMDIGFHLVYSLSSKLYPNGHTCSGENCRSNDHTNGDRDRTPHTHRDGGYAISQRWL